MSTYAIARCAAPVYSTPEPQQLEFIALPSTKFHIVNDLPPFVEVTTRDYSSPVPLYVDRRFLIDADEMTPERAPICPSADKILAFMQSKLGTRYCWGGNWADGIPEMKEYYPNLTCTDDLLCKGVDCSGLLYQATNGFTPRNTSALCTFGVEVELKDVRPLDMIVWEGHIVIVLDSEHTIESLGSKGVIISSLQERFKECVELTQKAKKQLHIRRWIS